MLAWLCCVGSAAPPRAGEGDRIRITRPAPAAATRRPRGQAATEDGAQIAASLDLGETKQKPSFPAGAVEQTAAVFAALAAAPGPRDAKALAAEFRRTKTTEKKVAEVLASLARLGYVATADGVHYALRRVA
ncbi:hypothetical protein [Rhodopseudomonas palustris]|uniref:hypothetical protein n=1 Tax=Rhodopseudomonas palustris TaxID=1076 RepID=UPI00005DA7AB|nr:hypothetical protein [Rhodopseudomonas palustris]